MPWIHPPIRSLVLLLATVLAVPLTALVGAAPAQAATFAATGTVSDGLGDPLVGVTVTARSAPAYTSTAAEVSTDGDGGYVLPLPAGSYRIQFTKAGYQPASYGDGDGPVAVVVDADGQLIIDGEEVEDNALDEATLVGTTTHRLDGTVSNGTTALAGITVEIFLTGDDEDPIGSAVTNGSGAYALHVPSARYQIRYSDLTETYLTTWYGGATPAEIAVRADETLSTVILDRPAAGQTFPIAGEVDDANGEPVDGVQVEVLPVGGSSDSGTDQTKTVGETGGLYSVDVLPGTYQVRFSKAGWVTSTYGDGATVTVHNAGTLTMTPAETLSGNRLSEHVLVSNPFAVTGKVETEAGSGIAGITVRAFPNGSTDPAEIVATATTTGTGSYTLTLPVDSYDLEFVDGAATPTYASTTLAEVQVLQDGSLQVGGTPVAEMAPVTLAVADSSTQHAVLGTVVDVNGTEIDGLAVTAEPSSGSGGDVAQSGNDGAHGRFRLMLKPGDYTIAVSGGGEDWRDATFTDGGTSTALVTVALNGSLAVNGAPIGGRDLGEIEVPGKRSYAVGGTVTNGTTGLAGITVKAYTEDSLTTPVATTDSVTGGAWTLSDLVVGTYLIEFSGSSGGNTYDRAFFGGTTASPVEIAQGGAAKVGGSPVDSNRLPAVVLSVSDADKEHPVVGEVVDVNEDSIAGATVNATPQGSGTAATDTSGTDGRYRLMLKQGTYRVGYTAPGFAAATYPGPGQTTVEIVVALDGTVEIGGSPVAEGELDQVELLDSTGDATISGRVLHDGSGVGGITVEVFPAGDESDTPVATTTTNTTSAVGSWTVGTLKIGTYAVRFTDNVVDANTYIKTYLGGADLAAAATVKVAQGNAIWVGSTPAEAGALGSTSMTKADDTTTYDLAGEVFDEADDPISGAAVAATPQGSGTPATASTDVDGRYVLQLRPGTYHVGYTAGGFVTYPGAGETPIEVVVAPGGAIAPSALDSVVLTETTGRASLSGRVTTPAGTGVTVDVFPEGDLDIASRVATVGTTADGTWSIATMKIGAYTVRFTHGTGAYVQTYYGDATDLAGATTVTVRKGSQVFAGEALMPGGALGATVMTQATADTTYPLRGTVEDTAGDPLPGVTVRAAAMPGTAVTTSTTTDAEGEYTLQVRGGSYEIEFSRSGGWTSGWYLNSDDLRAQVVVSSNGVTIVGDTDPVLDRTLDSFTLRGTAKHPLTGRVLGGGTGLVGITVRAIPVDTEIATVSSVTGAGGSYSLSLLVGIYKIEYVGRALGSNTWDGAFYGFPGPAAEVKIATGGAIYVDEETEPVSALDDVVLQKSTGIYQIRGTVSDENGDALAGATVRAIKAGTSAQAGSATTDVEGRYAVSVPVGKYSLRFEKTGKATTWLLNADSDTDAVAVVTVSAGGVITAPGVEFDGGIIEDVSLLLPPPRMVTAPKLTGKIRVGQKIATTLGTWNPDFRKFPDWQDAVLIEWFIDGKPADDDSFGNLYEKYKIPATAGGRKLSYRITIDDPSEDATRAQIVWNSKPVAVPKAKPKLTATYKKGRLTVVVKLAGLNKPLGSFVVLDGKKKVGKATLKPKNKGKAKIKLKKLKRGKHKLTVRYSGDANLAPVKVKLKIKV